VDRGAAEGDAARDRDVQEAKCQRCGAEFETLKPSMEMQA